MPFGEDWSEPLRVDNELSNKIPWEVIDEKDEAALRPRIQDINSGRTRGGKPSAQIAREHNIPPSLLTHWRDLTG